MHLAQNNGACFHVEATVQLFPQGRTRFVQFRVSTKVQTNYVCIILFFVGSSYLAMRLLE
jgi:hypothetical protein